MRLAIRVDWQSGAVCANGARLCSPVQMSKNGTVRYRVSQQITFGGHTGECLVDMAEGRLTRVAILFDTIRFLDASITESKIVRSIVKSSGLTVVSGHPTEA